MDGSSMTLAGAEELLRETARSRCRCLDCEAIRLLLAEVDRLRKVTS